MSNSQPFSISHNNPEADDSSEVFVADTVIPEPDEVPSLPPASLEESPQSFTSVLLRRIKSRHRPAEPSTTTATATATGHDANTVMPDQEESPATAARSEEISTNQSSSSSSKKRPVVTISSSHPSRKKTRQSSRLKRQQSQDQSCVDKSDSEVDDENVLEDYEPEEAVINQSSSSQTSATKELTKQELKWKSKFEELRAYKQLHGHTSVPQRSKDNKKLGKWVKTQRTQYKKFQANKKSHITLERVDLLNSIGFEWVSPNQGQRNESAWNKRFNELKEYKEKHGRTNVPTRWGDNKQLGLWVSTQRTQYKKFQENKQSQITPERIDLLNSIGFQWECRPGPGPAPRS